MIGAKNWTQTFVFSNFSGAAGISQQNPRTSRQKVWFPWVSKDIPNVFFWPPPLHVEDPHPTGRYPDPKVWICALVSSGDLKGGGRRKGKMGGETNGERGRKRGNAGWKNGGRNSYPTLPFLVFWTSLFFPMWGMPWFLSAFPFFSRDFGGSARTTKKSSFFLWFSLPFSQKQGKEGQGNDFCVPLTVKLLGSAFLRFLEKLDLGQDLQGLTLALISELIKTHPQPCTSLCCEYGRCSWTV